MEIKIVPEFHALIPPLATKETSLEIYPADIEYLEPAANPMTALKHGLGGLENAQPQAGGGTDRKGR